jgi:hypothetical protein
MMPKIKKITPALKGDFFDFLGSIQGLPACLRQAVIRKIKAN